ncbi:hypothetical protein LPJ73_002982 [Coemansia sp. RSA 2703]|nr:hypothetical protein LPJ73_002982 [Coemansia sp. RSA 2703]
MQSAMRRAQAPSQNSAASGALYNPWATQPQTQTQTQSNDNSSSGANPAASTPASQTPMFNPFAAFMNPNAAASPQASQQPPEERFQVQLQQLNDMGFWNAAQNIRALTMTGGNVEAAIEFLLSNPGN